MESNSRRVFIKQITTGILLGAFLNPPRQLFATLKSEIKLPEWYELVECARWCPSVHNLQPHKIKIISATEAELYYDPERLLPVGDPDSIFATVAMGVFIEHLSIAASASGAKVEIIKVFEPITTNASSPQLFAKLKLLPAEIKDELTSDLMQKRRTSRLHYDGRPLEQKCLNKISKETEKFNHSFSYSDNKEMTDFIIELNQKTLFEDLESEADRKELDHLFRYTKEEAETKRDGLWTKCIGFTGPLVKSIFRYHEQWEKGLRKKLLAKHYHNSFGGTTTICWFSGAFENTNHWLQAGKMLARNWLLLTKEGAYIQPFGSLITNKNAYKKINEKIAYPETGKKIWLIFRAGYSHEPARSYRLNTEEIIIK